MNQLMDNHTGKMLLYVTENKILHIPSNLTQFNTLDV